MEGLRFFKKKKKKNSEKKKCFFFCFCFFHSCLIRNEKKKKKKKKKQQAPPPSPHPPRGLDFAPRSPPHSQTRLKNAARDTFRNQVSLIISAGERGAVETAPD
jgi:hypothetical protein